MSAPAPPTQPVNGSFANRENGENTRNVALARAISASAETVWMRIFEPGRKSNETRISSNNEWRENEKYFAFQVLCASFFVCAVGAFFVWLNFGNARGITTAAFALLNYLRCCCCWCLPTLAACTTPIEFVDFFCFRVAGNWLRAVQIRGKRLTIQPFTHYDCLACVFCSVEIGSITRHMNACAPFTSIH